MSSLHLFFTALDTTNIQVKKQVFELLSALCVYNAEGYNRALEALEFYKVGTEKKRRFHEIFDLASNGFSMHTGHTGESIFKCE